MPPAGVHELPALQRPMALSPSRVHSTPLKHPPAPVAGARAQSPRAAPFSLLQSPAQHSASVVHTSPDCVQ
jgi:hypothetical protein